MNLGAPGLAFETLEATELRGRGTSKRLRARARRLQISDRLDWSEVFYPRTAAEPAEKHLGTGKRVRGRPFGTLQNLLIERIFHLLQ